MRWRGYNYKKSKDPGSSIKDVKDDRKRENRRVD